MSEELIGKCSKVLRGGTIFLFEKTGKDRVCYFSKIFPIFSFKASSFIFSSRALTIKRKEKKHKCREGKNVRIIFLNTH